ncbi:MBL fold metallo-hydrolase [Flexistipes sinusarabici]|nr:ribonuclease Z [Flexistipes sinusarabici]
MKGKSIKFTILGSGSAVPFENRASASYLLETYGGKFLLDCGFECVGRLSAAGFDPDELNGIFISHKHPDHFMGLIHLLFALKSPFYNREIPLYIAGFKGIEEYFNSFKKILGKWVEPGFDVRFSDKDELDIADCNFQLFPTIHSEESTGVCIIVDDKKIVYTSDTEYSDSYIDYLRNAELAVVDCAASTELPVEGHMNYREGLDMAGKAGVKRLVFSHFYPNSADFDLNRLDTDVEFYKARDLMSLYL